MLFHFRHELARMKFLPSNPNHRPFLFSTWAHSYYIPNNSQNYLNILLVLQQKKMNNQTIVCVANIAKGPKQIRSRN